MFRGSIVALVTPMNKQGEIDFKNLEKLVAWHLDNNTDGLVILGTTGESPTVEFEERTQIIKQVVEQVNERVPVIIGTGTNSTQSSIELTTHAMKLGADAALLTTPYYNKPTQEGLFQHYQAIANACPIPQILYNVPSRTACDLLPETVARLSKISNIVGLKEATGNLERLQKLSDLDCRVDFLSGDDATAMEFMLKGGKGVISVTANVCPKDMHDLCASACKGDRQGAENCDRKLAALHKNLFLESNPIPVKWALAQMKMIEESIRLPLTVLSEKFHNDVRNAMQTAGIEAFAM